ncbi:cytochrome c-type biogenesis protein CcsB [Marmoricola sp. OAE513]|uniref:c-type cytochrome biogenesis protein CcsB n=1 Tax=Marmoricola sp. OAE513 TaxID=2817894 RepID=UPI001AE44E95
MTHEQFELLSNQALAVCGAFYFIALLAHLAEWAAGRSVEVEATASQVAARSAEATAGGTDVLAETVTDVETPSERMQRFARVGLVATVVAAAVHLVSVVSRGLAADPVRVPWGNMYEFTLTGTLVVVIGYLLLYKKYELGWLSPVVTGFVLVTLMVDALLLYAPVVTLTDALESPWLIIHVVAAIIATGAFTLGGMTSVLYLIKERWLERNPEGSIGRSGYLARLPELPSLDRFSYQVHAFAFPIWTFAALIAGPIWARQAWGRYWGWDPKEVWAFITWVVYAAYLHARATAGWKGRAAAIVAIVGLATLWFNFVGINFFFGSGSQHSYSK